MSCTPDKEFRNGLSRETWMKTALLIPIFVAAGSPMLAKPYHAVDGSSTGT